MTDQPDPKLDPRCVAGIDLLGRTGAKDFQLRYSDDEQPVIWFAVVQHVVHGKPHFETASALNPTRAVLRLCERLIDGGECTHCRRPTGFEGDDVGNMPLDKMFCWWQWDPELQKFRRGCE